MSFGVTGCGDALPSAWNETRFNATLRIPLTHQIISVTVFATLNPPLLLIGIVLKFDAEPNPDSQHWYLPVPVKVYSMSEALVLEQYQYSAAKYLRKDPIKNENLSFVISPHKQPSTKSSR